MLERPLHNTPVVIVHNLEPAGHDAQVRHIAALSGLTPAAISVVFRHESIDDKLALADLTVRPEGRIGAVARLSIALQRHRVVLLGRDVAEAFGQRRREWYAWRQAASAGRVRDWVSHAVVPVHSAASAWMSLPDNAELAREWWTMTAQAALQDAVRVRGDADVRHAIEAMHLHAGLWAS